MSSLHGCCAFNRYPKLTAGIASCVGTFCRYALGLAALQLPCSEALPCLSSNYYSASDHHSNVVATPNFERTFVRYACHAANSVSVGVIDLQPPSVLHLPLTWTLSSNVGRNFSTNLCIAMFPCPITFGVTLRWSSSCFGAPVSDTDKMCGRAYTALMTFF